MAHNVENMFSVRETPWHGLGTVVQDAPSIPDAIKLAGLDWTVRTEQLQTADGRKVNAKCVVRDSDNTILGDSVGIKWEPLQNADAFAWFAPFLESGECHLTTAGSLASGSRVWIMAEMGSKPLEITDGDTVRKFLLLSHSHDGSLAVRVGFTPIRVVCANTLALAHGDAQSKLLRMKHTKNLAVTMSAVRDTINLATQAFEATAEQYRLLARTKCVSRADLRKYVCIVLGVDDSLPVDALPTRTQNILAAVLENAVCGKGHELTRIGGAPTWWTCYNAVTEYLSYGRGHSQDTRLNSLWYGDSVKVNAAALATALEMAS